MTRTVEYYRVWRCEVSASGYHNGCRCRPSEPHGGWNCGYVWVAPTFTDEEMQEN